MTVKRVNLEDEDLIMQKQAGRYFPSKISADTIRKLRVGGEYIGPLGVHVRLAFFWMVNAAFTSKEAINRWVAIKARPMDFVEAVQALQANDPGKTSQVAKGFVACDIWWKQAEIDAAKEVDA